MATPEAPIHDVIHAAWQFVLLASDEACRRQGWTRLPDRSRRLRLLLDAYGLPAEERSGLGVRVEAVEVGNGRARGVRLRGGEPPGTRAGVDGGLPHGSIP
jgi:hypothetical protein